MQSIYEITLNYCNVVDSGDEGAYKVKLFQESLPSDVLDLLHEEGQVAYDLTLDEWGKTKALPDMTDIYKVILDLYGDREREIQSRFDYSTLPTE